MKHQFSGAAIVTQDKRYYLPEHSYSHGLERTCIFSLDGGGATIKKKEAPKPFHVETHVIIKM